MYDVSSRKDGTRRHGLYSGGTLRQGLCENRTSSRDHVEWFMRG